MNPYEAPNETDPPEDDGASAVEMSEAKSGYRDVAFMVGFVGVFVALISTFTWVFSQW